LLYHPKQKPREGRGPQIDKHLPPSILLVNFYEKPTFRVWFLYRYLVHGPHSSTQNVHFWRNLLKAFLLCLRSLASAEKLNSSRQSQSANNLSAQFSLQKM
jgi:hypothetical protein